MAGKTVTEPLDKIDALLQVMAHLRDPNGGCPWDVQQNFATVAPFTIEEAYEVADAIVRNDPADIKEELGDLLLQVVFHAQIAKEAGLFDFADVVQAINDKMIRRHPHVFADADVRDAAQQTASWEAIKKAEKAARAERLGGPQAEYWLDSVSKGLPEFARAVKLQKRAAELGFDWPNLSHVFAKLREEMNELVEAAESTDSAHQLEELGDVLFVATNIARHLRLDPAQALRGCNHKFESRFRRMEELANAQGLSLSALNLEQQDALWDQAKLDEKAKLVSTQNVV
jgi:nucleoside triphosphate diphosphatase